MKFRIASKLAALVCIIAASAMVYAQFPVHVNNQSGRPVGNVVFHFDNNHPSVPVGFITEEAQQVFAVNMADQPSAMTLNNQFIAADATASALFADGNAGFVKLFSANASISASNQWFQ